MNKIHAKYVDKVDNNYINSIVDRFTFISNLIYDDRNIEDVVDHFLHLDLVKQQNMKRINELNQEIQKLDSNQDKLLNYPIENLRSEGKLIKLLINKPMADIHKLRNYVDIRQEFEQLDKLRFEEEKRNRGKNIQMSFNS